MAGNNKSKPKQNYIDQCLRQNGEDFIMYLKPDVIQRSAKQRIFREMVQGLYDYSVYGKYFTEPKFFENLLIAAADELQSNIVIRDALTLYDLQYPGNNLTVILKGKYISLVYVYQVLYDRLTAMKMSGYNVGYLADISGVLYQYKNQM